MNNFPQAEHVDVLIVGAGISGIGAACHLRDQMPGKSFHILEGLASFGGTWLTHKYPGVRSDSDLFTFGYRFKPWTGKPIATGEEIINYLGEVIDDYNLAPAITYNHRVHKASWDSEQKRWLLEVTDGDNNTKYYSANFLWMCQGYYKHKAGYTPEWPNMAEYAGDVIHPQHWPENYDSSDKKMVIIGSGATAATLAPALSGKCDNLTLLQRSPTYFFPRKNENELVEQLRALKVDDAWVHDIARKQILKEQKDFIATSNHYPAEVKAALVDGVKKQLPENFDVATHFTPRYDPWRQRIAVVPNGDIFSAIKAGQLDIRTDEIEQFTKDGLLLKSGEHLPADTVITATGFELEVLGGIEFTVDGEVVDFSNSVGYRGMMFTQLPNMLWVMGYFRASWTLRVDLIGDFVCRLLQHMEQTGNSKVEVTLREEDRDMELLPWIDSKDFNPGYMMRSMHKLAKRGTKPEWQHSQEY